MAQPNNTLHGLDHGNTADASLPAAPPDPVLVRLGIWLVFYGGAALMVALKATVPVLDPDIWWHLGTGQWVFEAGTVPQTDPLSSYGQGRPWVAYSWLFEVGLYGLYHCWGLLGILGFRVMLSLAVVLSIHALLNRYDRRLIEGACLTALVVLALMPLLNERTWLFSILFATWTLDAVVALRRGRAIWVVWLLPLVFALWANLHIQFIYGLAILGLGCAAPWFDRWLGWSVAGEHANTLGTRRWWQMVALTVACLAATLVNPYHVRLYGVVHEFATQTGVHELIRELQALSFRTPFDWAVLALAGAATFALGRRPQLSSFDILLLLAAAFCSFRTLRDVWFMVIAAVAIVPDPRSASMGPGSRSGRTGWLAVAVALAVLGVLWSEAISERQLEESVARAYPERAVAFLRAGEYSGPLFNHYNWGGYLIWKLPEIPVGIDGRANLHGDDRIDRLTRTCTGMLGWDEDPELLAARVILLPRKLPLTSLLRLDPRFQLVYEDDLAVVFIPRRQAAARMVQ